MSRRRYTLTYNNHEITAGHLYELLEPAEGTEVAAAWSNRFAAGKAAITARQVGKGTVIYIGTYLTADLVAQFAPGVSPAPAFTRCCRICRKGSKSPSVNCADRQLMFILNTREQPVHVRGVPDGLDLLTGTAVESHAVHLGEYGCSVIQLRHATRGPGMVPPNLRLDS